MSAPSVPLTLLTGFLGAGKTTVLNRILAGDHGLRIAVMVNDFGDLDIDETLVAGRSEGTLRLTNGCICCSLKEGLVTAVMDVLHREDRPDHIVLEASGVADPTGIATTLLAPVFGQRIRLDGVVCVIDALHFDTNHAERDLILRQLMVSDLILLNKCDLIDEVALANVQTQIRAWLSQARILPTVQGDAPLAVLLSSMHASTEALLDEPIEPACQVGQCTHPHHQPHAAFDTWYYETAEALCPEALQKLARTLPPTVYRIKGLARLPAPAAGHGIIQGVGRRLHVEPMEPRSPGRPSQLVVIGAHDSLDDTWLKASFDACCRADAATPA
ncbi:MAG: GTP-binding protein [Gammaproteobacteria bacterium]|nr:GTP-binding protein [Gammaproteobacteria bacterium]